MEGVGEKPEENHNVRPNNQSCSEKWGGYYTSLVAMLCLFLLHSITDD